MSQFTSLHNYFSGFSARVAHLRFLELRLHKLHFFNFMITYMIRIFSFQETS